MWYSRVRQTLYPKLLGKGFGAREPNMTRVLSMQCPFGMSDAVFLWLLAAVLVQHHARGYTTESKCGWLVIPT